MKIAYIIETLVIKGGTERILSEKANYLSEKFGYDIYFITCTQNSEQPNAYKLSNTIKQIYLRIPYYTQYKYKYPIRLWKKHKLNNDLHKAITKAVQNINPDILIGVGHFKADIICNINCHAKKIIECHEARYFSQSGLGQHQSLISKIYTRLYRNYYFRIIEKKADLVVTLTSGDKDLWKKAKYVNVIPNFSIMPVQKYSDCETKRIIAVGRLGWEKGYDRLIDIWKIIVFKHPDWKLDIFGEGELEDMLSEKITNEDIKNVFIHKTTDNISFEYSNSSICVMTSYYEGFALVLLEALKHGVPCIAFDCPFGPGCIIQNGRCGFLIENGNKLLFSEKICTLIDNENLRKAFSKAAIERSNHFSAESIMTQWKNTFESLVKRR